MTGFVCLVFLAALYLSHDVSVRHPDAMLPVESWDGAGMALTLGFVPLLTANVLALVFLPKGRGKGAVRLLFLAPGLICLCLAVSYWII